MICIRLCPGHLSVRVGDSLRRCEEIVKNLEQRPWMRLSYHHHINNLQHGSGHQIPSAEWIWRFSNFDRKQKKRKHKPRHQWLFTEALQSLLMVVLAENFFDIKKKKNHFLHSGRPVKKTHKKQKNKQKAEFHWNMEDRHPWSWYFQQAVQQNVRDNTSLISQYWHNRHFFFVPLPRVVSPSSCRIKGVSSRPAS